MNLTHRLRSTPSPRQPVLLVGHGTRDPEGVAGFLELAALVAERRPEWQVEPAFLEFAAPSIADGVAKLLAEGTPELLVVAPLLLFAAGHAKEDIPREVAAAVETVRGARATSAGPSDSCEETSGPPSPRIVQSAALELDADLHALACLRFAERQRLPAASGHEPAISSPGSPSSPDSPSLPSHPSCSSSALGPRPLTHPSALGPRPLAPPLAPSLLIVVGRGSSDPEATKRFHDWIELRRTSGDATEVRPAFVAMAEPKFEAVFAAALASEFDEVTVQPHFLFAGMLPARIEAAAKAAAAQSSRQRWWITNVLGSHARLAGAVESQIGDVLPDSHKLPERDSSGAIPLR